MASPVIIIELMPSRWMSSQHSSASKLATSTTRLPVMAWLMRPHWVAPCMRGAMGKKVMGSG